MKQFNFILQQKGGVGKSFLTYLLAAKNLEKERSIFVDVDSSTKTSLNQLSFLSEINSNRVGEINLLDSKKRIGRDSIFDSLEIYAGHPDYDEYFFDFGAPESEQFPALLTLDITANQFKQFADSINAEITFNIVIAGGTAYKSSIAYAKKLIGVLDGNFSIVLWLNENTFRDFSDLEDDCKKLAKALKLPFKKFGDFEPGTRLSNTIIANIEKGFGPESMGITAGFKFTNELAKLEL